ncbi:MAG: hypothetical protein D6732_08890, partial [Methanobacteriota archaeon]
RHNIPTPLDALWKVTGLSKLFPKSRIFARYNLTYLDPEKTYPVPAISGSFMMIRKEVLERVGFFDERFFMYCEDIDLCYRINQAGYKIYYVPTSQIIHYKGESTKKDNLDYVITFNKSLYLFFQKYYAQHTVFLFRWLITMGIFLRGVGIFIRNVIRQHFPLLLDVSILNLVILGAFILRFEYHHGFTWRDYVHQYWVINLLSSVIFLSVGYALSIYPRHRLSIQSILKNNIFTFTLVASLTFFLRQFAFSRMVVLISAVASPLLMVLWRVVLKRFYRGDRSVWGKDLFSKPTIIVGNGEGVVALYQKIREMKDISYDLVGVVTINGEAQNFQEKQIPVLGNMEQLEKVIRFYRIRQVIFSSEQLSYETILKTMSQIALPSLEYKIAPSNLEVVIGKSSIDRLDDYPLVEIEYAIGNPFNRLVKSVFDRSIALIVLLLTAPIILPRLWWFRDKIREITILGKKGKPVVIRQLRMPGSPRLSNIWLKLWEVLKGNISLVGAPIMEVELTDQAPQFWHTPGITGLVQINRDKLTTEEDREKYYLYYVKNQSLLLDIEILLRAIIHKSFGEDTPPGPISN